MKKYLIYVFWMLTVVLLGYLALRYKDASNAILAQVEPQRYAVSFQKAVKVREIYVMPGQRVSKGDKLIKVERSDLLLDEERKLNSLRTLHAELEIKKIERSNQIAFLKLNYEERLRKINTEIDQINMVMTNNKNLSSNLSDLEYWSNDSTNTIDQSYLELQLQVLEKEKESLVSQQTLRLTEIDKKFDIETATLNNEIEQVKQEVELLRQEENELIQYANVDGTIGNVYSEDEELVPPYTTLISVYEENPSVIRALMNESQKYDVNSGDKVTVESTNRKYKTTGTVMEIGSRIIEYPNRLRSHHDMPVWGRELFIKIPEKSNFLNGEKVFVIVNK